MDNDSPNLELKESLDGRRGADSHDGRRGIGKGCEAPEGRLEVTGLPAGDTGVAGPSCP